MKNKKVLYPLAVLLLLFLAWGIASIGPDDQTSIFVKPKKGEFKVVINSSGELRAMNSMEIMGPSGVRDVGIYQLRIESMVPEGTLVKTGDFIAELDKTDLHTRLQTAELELQRVQSQYEQAQLDSSLTLTQARNALDNLEFQLEEHQIAVEQSIYESPAVQRQTEIELERTQRQLEQDLINYEKRKLQAEAQLREIQADLSTERNRLERIRALEGEFTVTAPSEGMVIYERDRRGQRTTVGSTISVQNPVVAELPDFNTMESVTYINEVDIRNVRLGQTATIGLDADWDKTFTGEVISVANIGEQRGNSDARVFEVVVRINQNDPALRPTMTTSNGILVQTVPDAIYLPLETIYLIEDNHFVYKKSGSRIELQQVLMGAMNSNDVTILAGITENDEVLISMPPNTDDLNINLLPEDVIRQFREEQMEMEETPFMNPGQLNELSTR
ncbi:MAG: HlyD family efflux transporter periplasmic adaptor subunit [Balneolaceae bacterium]